MVNFIKNLFGLGPKINFKQLVNGGAIILDVRSKNEFENGHIKGAILIPLNQLGQNLHQLQDKSKVLITCCASGIRSASAKKLLVSKGYLRVYNGGAWSALQKKL